MKFKKQMAEEMSTWIYYCKQSKLSQIPVKQSMRTRLMQRKSAWQLRVAETNKDRIVTAEKLKAEKTCEVGAEQRKAINR